MTASQRVERDDEREEERAEPSPDKPKDDASRARGADQDGDDAEDAAATTTDADEDAPEPKWWEDFRDFYLTADRRTLGLTRVFLGFFLIFDLFRRTPDWWKMYSNEGVLPSHVNLWRPQSNGWTLFNSFATRQELWVLWAFGLGVYLCLFVGYKTKVMQVIAAIYVASMNGRVLLIENGGYVVHNLLLMWTAFLPLGDRFSVDAMLASMKAQKERGAVDLNNRETDTARWRTQPHVSLVSFFILLQLAAIYAFNVIHKTGPAWHDGTAVHYVLYVDRMVNPLIGAVRAHLSTIGNGVIIIVLTKSVMAMEAGLPLALLSPLARVWARRVAVVFMNCLHLGFATTFVLGPFAWALCVFSSLLFGREDWELAVRTMRRTQRARTVRYDPKDEAAFFWCRIIKRLDKLQLLTFEADEHARGLEVTTQSAARKAGASALFDIVAALPGGPIVAWLAPAWLGLGWLVNRAAGWCRRSPQEAGAEVGYRPELKDDAGAPRIDAYFMRDWLGRYNRQRVLGAVRLWGLGAAALAIGLFLYVYGVPMARKFNLDLNKVVFGGAGSLWARLVGPDLNSAGHGSIEWVNHLLRKLDLQIEPAVTKERLLNWLGFVLAAVGAYNLAKPFLVMNLTTPSLLRRKWLRVQAGFRESFACVMMFGAINQALVELWIARPLNAPQPEAARVWAHKLRYLQGWFMFSPNPVMDDGTIVSDCITVDGRRIDPFSTDVFRVRRPRPPDMDLLHAKSYGYNQIWSDYYNRMHLPQNSAFRPAMQNYIFRLPERDGNPNDLCVKGAVYWVHDLNPPLRQVARFRWYSTTQSYAYGRDELFTFTNPDPEAQRKYHEWLAAHDGQDPPDVPTPVPLPPKDAKAKR